MSSPITQKKVLVTGAAGFIASHVVSHCLKLGFKVTATDNLSGGFAENIPAEAEFICGDLRDHTFVHSLWQDRAYDVVYHLGAYAAEGLSHFVRRFNYETNLVASVNLINESVNNGVSLFVFTSSIAVYGAAQTPMTESMIPRPEDPYGISKYAVELDLAAAHELFGLNFTIFRPHNVYGERQNIADKYRNVIGIFMNQALQGEPMTVFGDGSQTRAFSYIDDVAPIIAKAPLIPEACNQIFNIGADTPTSVANLAEEVARSLNLPCNIKLLPARNEVVHAFSDHTKVRDVFSASSHVDLATGLARMAQWVKGKGYASPVKFKDIEIPQGLPISWRS